MVKMSSGSKVYDFFSFLDGFCETKEGLGNDTFPKEPGNAIFCLAAGIFGIFGIYLSRKHVSTTVIYLYSLIIGYGITSALMHCTLMNGFDKIAETILKFLQAFVVAGFAGCLRVVPPFNEWPRWRLALMMCSSGIYPALAIVLSSSSTNPWVGWLTFDGIWLIVLYLAVTIWRKQHHYEVRHPEIFNLVWLATISIIVAYAFWLTDAFGCTKWVAFFYPLGWWYVFLAWGFHNCIMLMSYLTAIEEGYHPHLTFWPNNKLMLLSQVDWNKRKKLT